MKRLDDGKVSLVEFMRSIKFAHPRAATDRGECATHFAHLNPQARNERKANAEDRQLVRSAN